MNRFIEACAFLPLITLIQLTLGHVSFIFPQARYPPLDFLDSSRTPDPCGVPNDNRSQITPFKKGGTYNIMWNLGYAHQGGFRIELLDKNDNFLETLTPETPQHIGTDDQTLQNITVQMPDRVCENCTLKLIRQAQEWGEGYYFKSCATISLTDAYDESTANNCFGHGTTVRGLCRCEWPYFGEFCQFINDCTEDVHCNSRGKCLPIQDFGVVRKVCYCQPSFFGKHCEKESLPSPGDCFNYQLESTQLLVKPQCYQRHMLNDQDVLLWRQIGVDLEMVLQYQTDSWVALGWRPKDISQSCYNFPVNVTTRTSDPLHPMDCTDIIVASAKGSLGRVGDYYTRDRSTPLDDVTYGGTNSLLAAYAMEANGVTTVMFRRAIQDTERADHPLSGDLHVIWAKGMVSPDYKFGASSSSRLQEGHTLNREFYKADEFKYHGDQSRGVALLTLTTSQPGSSPSTNERPPSILIGHLQQPSPESEPSPDVEFHVNHFGNTGCLITGNILSIIICVALTARACKFFLKC